MNMINHKVIWMIQMIIVNYCIIKKHNQKLIMKIKYKDKDKLINSNIINM